MGCTTAGGESWTETATDQLIAIRDYLARTSSGYAQTLAERIVRRTEDLANHPLLGAEVPEYADEGLREVFEHPYRMSLSGGHVKARRQPLG